MVDTGFFVPPASQPRLATLYHWQAEAGKLVSGPDRRIKDYTRPAPFLSGGGGLVSTMADYLRFCQMLLNKGVLDGVRLLGRETVELMSRNHLLPEVQGEPQPGFGFGLGVAVLTDLAAYGELGSVGMYRWGGAANTTFWIDPQEDLIGILMTQLISSPFLLVNDFRNLTYQALLD